ncbi:BRO-N domain-containing protein [Thermanaerosceptrum fracticalcis]|nr:Bro-N domain-containing protein [Thermanaerosceptrum fracticalcis]
MSNLALIKSEHFGDIQCDFYRNEQEQICMTTEQLGQALGYEYPKQAISKILDRYPYLREIEFSGVVKLGTPSGVQETRVFTEDGIYEVTFLAKTEKARAFRAWVRKILKALRKGEVVVVSPDKLQELEIKRMNAEARLINARVRQAKLILQSKDGKSLSPVSVELLNINALEVLTDSKINYRPEVEKTYTASDIAKETGISANKIGKIANANGLKTPEYGISVLDKSPYSDKQVPSWRYNEKGRQKLLELLKTKVKER